MTHNRQGLQLLDLCKATELRICNGRIEQQGAFTYCGGTGSSTIDYLLCSQDDLSCITGFEVLDFNIFSDHAPLYFTIGLNNDSLYNCANDDSCVRTRWDTNKRDKFRSIIISKLPEFNNILSDTGVISNRDNINAIVTKVCRLN